MDLKSTASTFVFFIIIYMSHVSGVKVLQLDVNILDGEVIVHWKHPTGAPPNTKYNVEMAKYIEEWAMLASCTGITNTYCDLSNFIHDHRASYKVRVQQVVGEQVSAWTSKRILPNNSHLKPPSFTLLATSSMLTVSVHQKPILNELFPFGVTYIIHLEEKGEEGKNTTAYLKDGLNDQKTKVFHSLHWGKMYCVSIEVEGNGASFKSALSPKQCLQLPEQEWFLIAVSSLSVLGVLALVVMTTAVLLCYLNHPGKTPAALISPVSGWLPLSVGEGKMEVVTDKGWFLSSNNTEERNCVRVPVTHITVIQDSEEEDRRTSTDSGISVESSSGNEGRPPRTPEDSGCGSMGGSESSTSTHTEYTLEDEGTDAHPLRRRKDSGVGMSCKLDVDDGQDSEQIKRHGGHYHSHERHMLDKMLSNSALAEVVTGYRAGPQSCICSGAGQCTWCHKQGEVSQQHSAACMENTLLASQCGLTNSSKGVVTPSDHAAETDIDSVLMNELSATFLPLGDTFPLLMSMSLMPQMNCSQDFRTNTSLSLCDVQLHAD